MFSALDLKSRTPGGRFEYAFLRSGRLLAKRLTGLLVADDTQSTVALIMLAEVLYRGGSPTRRLFASEPCIVALAKLLGNSKPDPIWGMPAKNFAAFVLLRLAEDGTAQQLILQQYGAVSDLRSFLLPFCFFFCCFFFLLTRRPHPSGGERFLQIRQCHSSRRLN